MLKDKLADLKALTEGEELDERGRAELTTLEKSYEDAQKRLSLLREEENEIRQELREIDPEARVEFAKEDVHATIKEISSHVKYLDTLSGNIEAIENAGERLKQAQELRSTFLSQTVELVRALRATGDVKKASLVIRQVESGRFVENITDAMNNYAAKESGVSRLSPYECLKEAQYSRDEANLVLQFIEQESALLIEELGSNKEDANKIMLGDLANRVSGQFGHGFSVFNKLSPEATQLFREKRGALAEDAFRVNRPRESFDDKVKSLLTESQDARRIDFRLDDQRSAELLVELNRALK